MAVVHLLSRVVPCRKFTRVARIVFLCAIAIFMLTLLSTYSAIHQLQDVNNLGLSMCPACYGQSMCPEFTQGNFRFIGWSKLRTLHFFNVKNVYYTQHKNTGEKFALKKLATNAEIEEIDRKLCDQASLKYPCHISKSLDNNSTLRHYNNKYKLSAEYLKGMSDLFACPSQRLVQLMIDKYKEAKYRDKSHSISDIRDKLMIISTLMINPEPIVLQMFPSEEGWPFPRYYGSCGRYVVEEYIGQTLDELLDADWSSRVKWAYEAAAIANQLTNNTSNFALYLTDVSLDNFAVGKDGHLKFIDLENIIVVDLNQVRKEQPPGWDQPMRSSSSSCTNDNCLTFSESALCSHAVSDHNYLAVCRNLLLKLLHHMPKVAVVQWRLDYLLERCVSAPPGLGVGGTGDVPAAAGLVTTVRARSLGGRYYVFQRLYQVLNSLHTLNIDISLN